MNLAEINRWPHVVQLGAVGKLPTQADFIRAGPTLPVVQTFDRWVESSLAHAQRELGPSFDEAYGARLYHRFVFRPQEARNTLVGVLRAAEDAKGRRYPIALYGVVPRETADNDPFSVLAVLDALFPHLEERIQIAAGMEALAELQAFLGAEQPVLGPALEYAARYESFLDDVSCGHMVGLQSEPGEALLSNLVEVVSSHRRRPQGMPQGILLPLNQPPFARGLEIQFWIELFMILLHWYPQELSWLSETADEAPSLSTLVLSSRQPAASLLGNLLAEPNVLWRPWLDRPFVGASVTERVTVHLHPEHTLRQLLEYLCPGYPSVCPWRRERS